MIYGGYTGPGAELHIFDLDRGIYIVKPHGTCIIMHCIIFTRLLTAWPF